MFRRVHDALARLLGPPRSNGPTTDCTDFMDLAREARTPDPYVWRQPNPYDARWRRWAKRNRATGRYLPVPREEECWQAPARTRTPPTWQTDDDVVRPYILSP
ncbi:hypothetical protein ACFC09_45120 [Streptomyces sp. NPDC056161]|uniref:hypothetical protein n=1 Tax=Streptomyces sp. NPDC056161 TaxID=3345732 RepID=UPI0035E38343